jgi:hypothetical protein
MSSFADDNFKVLWNRDKNKIFRDMEKEPETLTKWLDSV